MTSLGTLSPSLPSSPWNIFSQLWASLNGSYPSHAAAACGCHDTAAGLPLPPRQIAQYYQEKTVCEKTFLKLRHLKAALLFWNMIPKGLFLCGFYTFIFLK